MNSIILTVIGGGSVNWMRLLMKDVYLLDCVDGGEIRLVDPNTEHTEAVAEMLRSFNKMRNKEYKISIYENRIEALQGADFVMTTFSPGAMESFWNDLEIPMRYGIRQPVSMTVGPCGISAALRTIPVAFEIVTEMEKACPNAWLLNVTNPMTTVTRAMNLAAKKTKVIGLCHEFHALPTLIGPILGLNKPTHMGVLEYLYKWLPAQGFDYTIAGLNHFIWLTKATLRGEDVIPTIRKFAYENWQIEPENAQASPYSNKNAAKLALCRNFGYLPIVGDRHLVEFYPSLCNPQNGYGLKFNVNKTTVDSRKYGKDRQLREIKSVESSEMSWEPTGEEMTELMRAIITKTTTTAIVNMPNSGQIINLPKEVVVETLATCENGEIRPKSSGVLPSSIGSLCRLHSDVQELTVRAALEGNRELLVEALSLDPGSGCADFSRLKELSEELLIANRQWLPRFFKQ